jgi:glycosyltransferase involved in cell wall biosynthesis
MHVVLDGQALVGGIPTGFGVYAQLVADALKLLARRESGFNFTVVKPQPEDRPLASVWRRVLWEQFILRSKCSEASKPALLHSPCLGAPLFPPLPLICTVHDLILLDEEIPGMFAREYFRRLVPAGWRQAKLVLTDTEYVRRRVTERLRIPAERVVVLPLYSRYEDPSERWQPLPGPPRFLMVGTVESRKGFTTAIAALAQLPEPLKSDARLVIVGKRTKHAVELTSLAQRLGVQQSVEFADYQKELAPLYLGASALGFGLPPLEAMSLGLPVILSDIAVLRETYARVGDAVNPGMFPSGDESALAQLMRKVVEDSSFAASLASFGRLVAKRLTRAKFANGLLAAYRRITEES